MWIRIKNKYNIDLNKDTRYIYPRCFHSFVINLYCYEYFEYNKKHISAYNKEIYTSKSINDGVWNGRCYYLCG